MRPKILPFLALLAALGLAMVQIAHSEAPLWPTSFDWRPPGYDWTMPPIAALLSVSMADPSGLATVTGAAGAVPANQYVFAKNVSTGDFVTTLAAANGSFTTPPLFAPEDSAVQVAYSDPSYIVDPNFSESWQGEPATLLYVDNIPNAGPQNVAWTLSGLVAPSSSNGTFVANGLLSNSRLNPGDTFSTTVNVRVGVTPGLVYDFDAVEIKVRMGLERMFDASGQQHGSPNRAFASTLLAPTGLPILQDKQDLYGNFTPLAELTIASADITQTGDVLTTIFVLNASLPANLPDGLYRPTLTFKFGELAEVEEVVSIKRDGISTAHNVGATPYLPVIQVGDPADPRLVWMLLTNTLSNGSRGTVALEDRDHFDFSPLIVFQANDFIIPKDDFVTGSPISYRLEPFMPLVAATEKYQLAFPRLPFAYPGGSLTVQVQQPDGTVDTLGPAVVQQSLDSLRAFTTFGSYPVFVNPGPGYVYEVTTLNNQFDYQFTTYGRHLITMTGTIADIWSNEYTCGGTYEVYVARMLALNLSAMPGMPFEVGDNYAPGVVVEPNVPAQIGIRLRQYSGPTGALMLDRTISGQANNAGYFHPGNIVAITFTQPGEYVVDVHATYTDADGVLWMGSIRGAGVIETPGTPLIAHGKRGINFVPEADSLAWFFTRDLPGGSPDGDVSGGEVHLPYHRGDIYWFIDTVDDNDVLYSENNSEKPLLTAHDTVGEIADLIGPSGNEQGQMGLFSRAIWPCEAGSFPEFTNIWAYGYSVSQRPGIPIRSLLIESDYSRGYWNSDDPYNLVIGNGVIGDLPNDYKFQYGGVVVRYLGDLDDPSDDLAEYAAYASGAVMFPRGGLGNRVTPPFRGTSGGPDGGPLLTIKGEDIDIFVHPTGVRPGTVLETGDVLAVAGAVMPPLGSLITVTVDGPSGQLIHFSQHANKIGYLYNPDYDLRVTEPGLFTVTMQVLHDGPTSTGLPPLGHNRGDVLNTVDGAFNMYVVPAGTLPLCLDAVHDTLVTPAVPITITGHVPPGMTDATVYYTVRMPDIVMENGTLALDGNQFAYVYDPVALHADFRNLDIFDLEGQPSAVDPVTMSFYASGRDTEGQPMYRGRSLLLQGDNLLADVSAWPNGLIELGADSFRPPTVTIAAGNSATWLNCGEGMRQVDGDGWSSGPIPAYGSFSRVFDSPVTYFYRDANTPSITGVIIVTQAPNEVYLPVVLKSMP